MLTITLLLVLKNLENFILIHDYIFCDFLQANLVLQSNFVNQ